MLCYYAQCLQEARLLNQPVQEHDIMEQILEHLGGMGTYQRYLFFMMMPIMFIYSFVYGVQMFVAATPQQHWCRVPELMHLDVDLRWANNTNELSLFPFNSKYFYIFIYRR